MDFGGALTRNGAGAVNRAQASQIGREDAKQGGGILAVAAADHQIDGDVLQRVVDLVVDLQVGVEGIACADQLLVQSNADLGANAAATAFAHKAGEIRI